MCDSTAHASRALTVQESFGPHRLSKEDILEDAHATFCLPPSFVQIHETIFGQLFLEDPGTLGADGVVDLLLQEKSPIVRIIKSTIRRQGSRVTAKNPLKPFQGTHDQVVVGGNIILEQLPVNNDSRVGLSEEKHVAELHLGAGLAPDQP